MAEELPQLWEKFTLTEDEDLELEIPVEKFQELASRGQACIVGKLLTDRLVSKEIVKESLSRWWKPVGGLSFKVIGDNLFLIDFTNREDKELVLAGTPWVFEGSLFLIEDFDGTFAPSEFTFDHAAFWVRMRNLPLACMSREIGQMIGATVGGVEAIDTNGEGLGWGEALRVKIHLDLTKPLPRGRKIKLQGEVRWITFQYERLPKRFCYNCGVIIHGKAGCTRRRSFRHQEQEYGPWLRAASLTRVPERNQGINTMRGPNSQGNAERGERETHWDGGNQKNRAFCRTDVDGEGGGGANPTPQNRYGGEGGTNHGLSDGKIREDGRLQKDRHSQGKERHPDHNVLMGEDLRVAKKGKWEEGTRNISLNASPGHVNGKNVNGLVDKFSMGPNGITSSPMSLKNFTGPIFSVVERTMQVKRGGKKKERGENKSAETGSWQRKVCEVTNTEEVAGSNNGAKLKRDVHGDLKPIGDSSNFADIQNGSRMAVAVAPPTAMKIISWNCRGLGNPRIVWELCRMVKQKRPAMVFLMETKLHGVKMEVIRCKLSFENMFVVNCVGKSGGMALFWGDEVSVNIKNFSQRHIGGLVTILGMSNEWQFTGFYGHPEPSKRFEAWALMKYLARHSTTPWVCIGDFNEVVDASEKWGGKNKARSQMSAFRQALEYSHLADLGYVGPKFTWSNCREGHDFTKERLDRGVANQEWRTLYPEAKIWVDVTTCSDHFPLTLVLTREEVRGYVGKKFRYEASWALNTGFDEMIKKAWQRPPDGNWGSIGENLRRCQVELSRWQQSLHRNLHGKIKRTKQRLSRLQGAEIGEVGSRLNSTKAELKLLLDQEE